MTQTWDAQTYGQNGVFVHEMAGEFWSGWKPGPVSAFWISVAATGN